MFTPIRIFFVVLLGLLVSVQTQAGAKSASDFIDKLGSEALQTFKKDGLTDEARIDEFSRMFNDAFAVKGIARFALGRHWRLANEDQKSRYLSLFERYVTATYARRFKTYADLSFDIKGERDEGKKGTFVTMLLTQTGKKPVRIDWRVKKSKKTGEFKIIDVIIENVSMSVTQRSDFATALQGQGGDIDKFLDTLETKITAAN